jgi:hypothetical protein
MGFRGSNSGFGAGFGAVGKAVSRVSAWKNYPLPRNTQELFSKLLILISDGFPGTGGMRVRTAAGRWGNTCGRSCAAGPGAGKTVENQAPPGRRPRGMESGAQEMPGICFWGEGRCPPISPPSGSGPTHWLFQGPPAESKFLAVMIMHRINQVAVPKPVAGGPGGSLMDSCPSPRRRNE